MTLSHKTLAAALLCGAVGFAFPSYAADYGSGTANSSSTAGTAENGSTGAATTSSTPAKETKKAVRPRRTAARAGGDEHAIVEALNQKSLEAVQSGQSPDFAAVEPANNRQAQNTKASSKAIIRHRATTKAKKGA